MKGKKWLIPGVSLALAWLLGCAVTTGSFYSDGDTSAANDFQASASTLWRQTMEADFNLGALTDLDLSASQGDVQLSTATTILGNSDSDADAETAAGAVHTQLDINALVPCNGVISSWTCYGTGADSNGVRLEFLSGSGTAWTMMAKSDAVSVNGTDTFNVSIPVQAGWQLGIYSGSGKLKYNSLSGTLSARAEDSGDFGLGLTQSDFLQAAGQLALTATLSYYHASGNLASQVLDTHLNGASWNALAWDKALPGGTNITFEARASDTLFARDSASPPWASPGAGSPVTSQLPSGRYKQWRATLTTIDTMKTPVLHEVRLYYN